MPTLTRTYSQCLFNVEVIQEAVALIEKMSQEKIDALPAEERKTIQRYALDNKNGSVFRSNSITRGNDVWNHDSFEEFFADYRRGFDSARIGLTVYCFRIVVAARNTRTDVEVAAMGRPDLEKLFDVFERKVLSSRVEEPPAKAVSPVIFIGHGGSGAWRDLKDHLHEKHDYDVQAYEVAARAGHTIRDILDEMMSKSSFAVLVMTAEDETAAGAFNPRLNVVHELGLFQGKLGFSRAIVLLEEGTAEFSNIHGIQQVRFSKGKIRETFGDVVATLKREFS